MATKKVKKVETPIDQRETFVSIQKNFADSDVNVGEKLKVLYDLQKADTAIDKILQLRGELPAEVETLEKEIAEIEATNARILQFIDGMTQTINNCKQDILDCDNQITKYQMCMSFNKSGSHKISFSVKNFIYCGFITGKFTV